MFSAFTKLTYADISVAENGTFDYRLQQEVELENNSKPQELIKGSLVFRHTTEKSQRLLEKAQTLGSMLFHLNNNDLPT